MPTDDEINGYAADLMRAELMGDTGQVDALKAKGATQATTFPKDHRLWGWFESLVVGDRFQVKRIYVHPGASLSLQSHHHRAEHWIVVSGTAEVTIDDQVQLVTENQSVYIPLGAVHRMKNPGKVPMVLIEVQTRCLPRRGRHHPLRGCLFARAGRQRLINCSGPPLLRLVGRPPPVILLQVIVLFRN